VGLLFQRFSDGRVGDAVLFWFYWIAAAPLDGLDVVLLVGLLGAALGSLAALSTVLPADLLAGRQVAAYFGQRTVVALRHLQVQLLKGFLDVDFGLAARHYNGLSIYARLID
jgi:hypothetical protein